MFVTIRCYMAYAISHRLINMKVYYIKIPTTKGIQYPCHK